MTPPSSTSAPLHLGELAAGRYIRRVVGPRVRANAEITACPMRYDFFALPLRASSHVVARARPRRGWNVMVVSVISLEFTVMTDLFTTPEILAAAELLTERGEINDEELANVIPIDSMQDAIAYLACRGVPAIFDQVGHELGRTRAGQGLWKQMKLDLLEKPENGICPIDYHPELAPELAAYYKSHGKMDLDDQLFPPPQLSEFAELLEVCMSALVTEHTLEQLEGHLSRFARKIGQQAEMREALRRVLAKQAQTDRAARADRARIDRQELLSQLKADARRQSRDASDDLPAAASEHQR